MKRAPGSEAPCGLECEWLCALAWQTGQAMTMNATVQVRVDGKTLLGAQSALYLPLRV